MTAQLLAPAILAVVAGALGGWLRRRLPPRAAVVLLTVVAVASSAAVVWALALVVIGGVLGVPDVLAQLRWCRRVLSVGHEAPPAVALSAAVVLGVGTVRLIMFELRWRRTVRCHNHAAGVAILDVDSRMAFAVPGREGTVVVSRGLLAILEPEEQAALFAHEHCHLDRRHDRYLRAAGLAAALVPVPGGFARNVRFATEREADEAAARAVGDRRTVARAIASAAIGTPVGRTVMAMGDLAVAERVEELLYPQRAAWFPAAAVIAGLLASSIVLSGSTLQLHHLVSFGAHVCGLD